MANLENINNLINQLNNVLNRNVQYQLRTGSNRFNTNNNVSINRFHSLIHSVNTNLSALSSNLQKLNGSFSSRATQTNSNNGNSLGSILHGYGITNEALASHIASVIGSENTPKQSVHQASTQVSHAPRAVQYRAPITRLQRQFNHTNQRAHTLREQVHRVQGRASRINTVSGMREHYRDIQSSYADNINNIKQAISRISAQRTKRNAAIEALERQDNGLPSHLNGNILNSLNNRSIVHKLANGTGPNSVSARDYLSANSHYQQDTQAYSESISQLRKLSQSASNASEELNNLFNNSSNGFLPNLTTNEEQARFNPNATYVHYPSSTPTGMIQNMGGTTGLAVSGIMTAGSAIRGYSGQGNSIRQQMEPGVNALTLGRAINGAPNVGHLDNHVADQLMQEGRWNGQTSQDMSQYLGALAGTRNTGAMNQTRTAGDVAQFARNNNVNPTDTSQLFSTLANSGGLGNQNDHGNVVDFTRQFAGMLHNDHLGAVSNQQAQGLNSIFGNMIGSGQTLTPQTVRNVTAMQGVLSSGPGGRVFQGQSGAQQLNNLNQGVGSQFNNMMVRNAFAGANAKYGGQQGLYRLALDMQSPLKHPQQLMGMVQNLSSEVGPEGTKLALNQMGLAPDAASQFYRDTMNGKMSPQELHRLARRDERIGKSSAQHTNKQYRMQGNSTLDIKVAMGQQGRIHTSESFDALRRTANRAKSLLTPSGFLNDIGVEGGSVLGTIGTASNISSMIGLLTGRNGNISSNGLLHSRLNPLNWFKDRGKGSTLFQNSKHSWLRRLGRSVSGIGSTSGSNGNINSQGSRFNNNYFYNNHFIGGSGESNNSNGSGGTGNSDNSNNSTNSSGDSTEDTDNESYGDKRDSLENERDEAKKNGDIGKAREMDQRISDLDRDHANGGGWGDRALNWLNHDKTGRVMNVLRDDSGHVRGATLLRNSLNWLGHGSTGNLIRSVRNHMGQGYANVGTSEPYANRIADAKLGHAPMRMNLQTFADRATALKPASDIGSKVARGSSVLSRIHGNGLLAAAAFAPEVNDYLNRPTWGKTKNLGSNAVTAGVDSMSGPIGWGLTGAQTLGGALGHATGNKTWNGVARLANVGDDIFHPERNFSAVGRDFKSAARFTLHHPTQGFLSLNPTTIPLEEMYRNRHGLERFARHPLRTTGHGLHALGGMIGRGWRGLKSFAGNTVGRVAGGLGNTILGRGGALALARNYIYLREINRLLPRMASKLAGMFGVASITGTKGNAVNSPNVTNTTGQENIQSMSKNNGNTTNTDNSTHDNHATNNYYIDGSRLGGGASGILSSPLMNFFSHSHGDATS